MTLTHFRNGHRYYPNFPNYEDIAPEPEEFLKSKTKEIMKTEIVDKSARTIKEVQLKNPAAPKGIKELPILTYTENSPYGLPSGFKLSLGLIDKKEKTAESRLSEDENLANKYGYFRACLEEANRCFTRPEDKSMIFHGHPNRSINIRNLISYFEDKLNLKIKSQVFATNIETITAIRISPFWMDCRLKKTLLFILIRAGQEFKVNVPAGTLEHVAFASLLGSQDYLPKLKNMIELFLDGYTKFNQTCLDILDSDFHKGIVFQFQDKSKDEILAGNLLIKENN